MVSCPLSAYVDFWDYLLQDVEIYNKISPFSRVSLYFLLFGLVGEPFLELLPDLSDVNANSRVKIFQDSAGKFGF